MTVSVSKAAAHVRGIFVICNCCGIFSVSKTKAHVRGIYAILNCCGMTDGEFMPFSTAVE